MSSLSLDVVRFCRENVVETGEDEMDTDLLASGHSIKEADEMTN